MEIIKLANDVITASGSLADTCQEGCFDSTIMAPQDAGDEC